MQNYFPFFSFSTWLATDHYFVVYQLPFCSEPIHCLRFYIFNNLEAEYLTVTKIFRPAGQYSIYHYIVNDDLLPSDIVFGTQTFWDVVFSIFGVKYVDQTLITDKLVDYLSDAFCLANLLFDIFFSFC